MSDVVRWLDDQEEDEVEAALGTAGELQALQALRACFGRDARQRSGVYTTAETVVEVFADPLVAASADVRGVGVPGSVIDPGALLAGGQTVFLSAPAVDQRRLRPVFSALVADVLDTAMAAAERGWSGRLLVVLDEAANIAPIADLDTVASTAAGAGIQLVTVWQDLAQLRARYGERAATVVNNHGCSCFLPGIKDPGTLDHVERLVGLTELVRPVHTEGPAGAGRTWQAEQRPLLAGDALRRLPSDRAVVITGNLPPLRIRLRPWYRDPDLRRRVSTTGRCRGG
jgi:type IV secretion system protein VirD4